MKGSPRFHFALPFRRGVPGASFPEPPFCFLNPCRSRTCGKSGEARPVSAGLSCSRPLSLCSSDTSLCGRGGGGVFFFRSRKSEVGSQNEEAWSQEVQMSNRQIVHKPEVGMRLAPRRGATTLNPVQAKRSSGEPKLSNSPKVQLSNRPKVQLSKCPIVQLSKSPKSQDI